MISQGLLMCHTNPLIIADAADFDGTNDWMARGAGLTGASDSKTGIFSCWARLDVDQLSVILRNSNARVSIDWNNSPSTELSIALKNSAGTTVLVMITTAGSGAGATWHHFLASWDLAASATHLYLDGVSDLSILSGPVDSAVDYTDTDWAIAATVLGGLKYSGCLTEMYFAPGQYLDFSLVANRRKFISASGKPVHLGATGSLPTGTAPLLYHHIDNAEAVANFATNRGTGGNFTITGTLDTGSTSPSD